MATTHSNQLKFPTPSVRAGKMRTTINRQPTYAMHMFPSTPQRHDVGKYRHGRERYVVNTSEPQGYSSLDNMHVYSVWVKGIRLYKLQDSIMFCASMGFHKTQVAVNMRGVPARLCLISCHLITA